MVIFDLRTASTRKKSKKQQRSHVSRISEAHIYFTKTDKTRAHITATGGQYGRIFTVEDTARHGTH